MTFSNPDDIPVDNLHAIHTNLGIAYVDRMDPSYIAECFAEVERRLGIEIEYSLPEPVTEPKVSLYYLMIREVSIANAIIQTTNRIEEAANQGQFSLHVYPPQKDVMNHFRSLGFQCEDNYICWSQ